MAIALGCLALSMRAADDPLAALDQVTTEWIHTRQETVRVRNDWAQEHELLQSLVDATRERADAAEAKRDAAVAKHAKERSDLQALEQQIQADRDALAAWTAALQEVDRALAALRPQLPPRLSASLELPFRTLSDPKLGISERAEETFAVFARCEQFDHGVTFAQEVVAAPGLPRPKLLDCVYWGLSHGYAFDAPTGQAWLGRPEANGWTWTACPQAVAPLRTLLAGRDQKLEPQFVALPAQLAK